MLALVQSQHRNREVGVIRNGRGHGIKLISAFVEHLTIVTEPLGLGILGKNLLALRPVNIDIAKGDDVYHPGSCEILDDLLATVADADKGDLYLLAARLSLGGPPGGKLVGTQDLSRSESHAGGSHGHGLEEISSVNHILVL